MQPKTKAAYKLIGREGRLQIDAPNKILGKTSYTIDVALPDLLTAVVLHPPRFGAEATDIDDHAALAEAGVVAVLPIEEGVAVVGETLDDVHRGLLALKVTWDDTGAERRISEEHMAEHRRLVETGENAVIVRDEGEAEASLTKAAHSIDAIYELPYLAHAPMGPNNAVSAMRDDGVIDVWTSTESPEFTRIAASGPPVSSGRTCKCT